MKVPAPYEYEPTQQATITMLPLKENKRPVGFAAWSTEDEKPKRKPRPRKKAT